MLSEGALGNGAVIYPKLLPLLSKYPTEEVELESFAVDSSENTSFSSLQEGSSRQVLKILAALSEGIRTGSSSSGNNNARDKQHQISSSRDFRHGVTALFECSQLALARFGGDGEVLKAVKEMVSLDFFKVEMIRFEWLTC